MTPIQTHTTPPDTTHAPARGVSLLATIALLCVCASTAHTQDAPAKTRAAARGHAGTWVLTTPNARAMIDKKIEPVVQKQFNIVSRQFARMGLRKGSTPHRTLSISVDPTTITVRDGGGVVTTPNTPNKKTTIKRRKLVFSYTQHLKGDTLHQRSTNKYGARHDRLVLGPRGDTLTLHATMTSDDFDEGPPDAIRFTLTYRRKTP